MTALHRPIVQRAPGPVGGPARQEGAVLIVALIILLILTLLGVTAMTTTSLEEKMAANSQETTRSLQTAETGLAQAYLDSNTINSAGFTQAAQPVLGSSNEVGYTSRFIGFTSPPPGSVTDPKLINSLGALQAGHFNVQSTGTTGSGVTTVLHGGMYQITAK